MEPSSPKQSFQLLQAYRGVAAMLVLLYHASPLFHLSFGSSLLAFFGASGYAGVDIFFVLSGFIICYVHHKDLGKPDRIKFFIIRRVTRVFPAYWLVTLALIPIYFAMPSLGEERYRDIWFIIQSLLLFPQPLHPILTVGWTLTHELLFYAIFALGIILPWRKARLVAATWLGLSLLSAPFAGFLSQHNHLVFGFLLSRYNLEFALGCLSAYLALRARTKYSQLVAWLGAILLLVACTVDFLTKGQVEPYRVVAYGLPAMLLVLGSVWLEQERKVVVPVWLRFLGDASYSLYLVHLPMLSLSVKIAKGLHLGSYGAMIVCVLLTLAGGLIFHITVEKPLLKGLSKAIGNSARLSR